MTNWTGNPGQAVVRLPREALKARPGSSYSFRPMCKVIELRGRYQGLGDFEGCTDPLQACEVLLEYPTGLGTNNAEGTREWHYGPVAGRCQGVEIVEFELTFGDLIRRMDAAWKLVCPKPDWRAPINVSVLRRDMELMRVDVYDVIEAIGHYTTTKATVVEVGRGYDIKAPGYRAGPAGPYPNGPGGLPQTWE